MSELRAAAIHNPNDQTGGIEIDNNDDVTIDDLTSDNITVTDLTATNLTDGTTTSTVTEVLAATNGALGISGVNNLLMNSGFAVNQRNPDLNQLNLTPAGSVWIADRWLGSTTGGNCTITYGSPPEASPDALQLVCTPAADAAVLTLVQSIELPLSGHNAPISNGEYTLSIITDMEDDSSNPVAPSVSAIQFRQGTVIGADGTNACSGGIPAMTVTRNTAALGYGGSYQQWSTTVTVDTAAASTNRCCNIVFIFSGHQGNTFRILSPQMTRGSIAPEPSPIPFALEWQNCLRYYYRDNTTRQGTWANSGTTAYVTVSFPQRMRRIPSISSAESGGTLNFISQTGYTTWAQGGAYAYQIAPIIADAEFNT